MNNSSEKPTFSQANFANLSDEEKKIIKWLKVKKQCTQQEVVDEFAIDTFQAQDFLLELTSRNLLKVIELEGDHVYILKLAHSQQGKFIDNLLKNVEQ